jgi:hypothetical protein
MTDVDDDDDAVDGDDDDDDDCGAIGMNEWQRNRSARRVSAPVSLCP